MPSTRVARPSVGQKKIPSGFILNWQSAPHGKNARPLVRRPMTACGSCRAAKVKCDTGQPECERCVSRGLSCKYNTINHNSDPHSTDSDTESSPRQLPEHQQQPLPPVPLSQATTAVAPSSMLAPDLSIQEPSFIDDLPIDLNPDMLQGLYADNFLDMTANGNLLEWTHELEGQLGQARQGVQESNSDISHASLSTDPSLLQSLNDVSPPSTLSDTHIRTAPFPGIRSCQCRSVLLTQVPRVKTVMQQLPRPKLGNVFKVTQDVIQCCQNLIECSLCQLNWSDILCIMAVFQPTQSCFTYLGQADTNDVIHVSVDSFDISLFDSATMRRILIKELLKRASDFLARLNALGSYIMKKQLPLGSLCRINLDYLNNAIGDCETTLRSVNSSVEENSDDFFSSTDLMADGMAE